MTPPFPSITITGNPREVAALLIRRAELREVGLVLVREHTRQWPVRRKTKKHR